MGVLCRDTQGIGCCINRFGGICHPNFNSAGFCIIGDIFHRYCQHHIWGVGHHSNRLGIHQYCLDSITMDYGDNIPIMAIQIQMEVPRLGITVPTAYVRVVTVMESRTNDPANRFSVMIDYVPYMTQPTTENVEGVELRRVHIPQSILLSFAGDSYIQKAYSYLLALPEFAGAESV